MLISADLALSVVDDTIDTGEGGTFSSIISGPPPYSSTRNFHTISFTT